MNKKLTSLQIALLENLSRGNVYSRWIDGGEKSFVNMGVKWPTATITHLVKRGFIVIENGVGMNEGIEFLEITDAGYAKLDATVNE